MRILTYDTPQVQGSLLDGARLNPASAQNPFGSIGQGMQRGLAGIEEVQRQADSIKGEESLNSLREIQQGLTQRVQKLNGQNAFNPEAFGAEEGQGLHETALGWFDEAVRETGEGLSGHAQTIFRQGAARFRAEFSGHVQQHETRESGVVAKDTYQGAQAVEDQNIAQNGIGLDGRIQFASIDQSVGRKVFAANQLSDWLGEGPDMRKARELEARSSAYLLVLDGLLKRNNTQGAQVFFDAHRENLDKQVVSLMEGKIQQVTLANDVQAHADRIQALGLPLDQQDSEARKVFAKNPEGMHALQSELEHRFTVQKTAQAAVQQDTYGKLWDMRFPTMPGQQAIGMPDVMRSPEWAQLNGTQRNELRSQWENFSKRNENDPAVMVAKYATYQRFLDDPKSLMGMTDAQISSFMGSLGPELTMRLMDSKRKAQGNLESLKANTLNDIPFKDIAGEYGIKTKGTLTQENLGTLGLLRNQVMESIRSEQAATGKPATPERKEEILRGLLTNSTQKRSWFNPAGWVGDTYTPDGKPLFKMKDFMEVPGTEEEKTLAIGYLVQNEAPVTPANMQTMLTAIRKKRGVQ